MERIKRTQIELIKTNYVLQSAIRDPGIASLSIFAGKDDPVSWLQDNIEVEFPKNSEVMVISLRANPIFEDDIKRVVDAVAAAYQSLVVDKENMRQLKLRDQISRVVGKIETELKAKTEVLYNLEADLGSEHAQSAEFDSRRIEISTMTEILRHMRRRLAIIEINAQLPEEMRRVRLIQPAVVTYE